VNTFVEAPEDLEWACATILEGLFQCDSGYFLVQYDPFNPSEIIEHSRIFLDTDEVVEWCIHAGAIIPDDVMEDFTERYSEGDNRRPDNEHLFEDES